MMLRIKGHWEGDVVVPDEPIPAEARLGSPLVVVNIREPGPSAEERIQSASGFVRTVLLDVAEDAWEHD